MITAETAHTIALECHFGRLYLAYVLNSEGNYQGELPSNYSNDSGLDEESAEYGIVNAAYFAGTLSIIYIADGGDFAETPEAYALTLAADPDTYLKSPAPWMLLENPFLQAKLQSEMPQSGGGLPTNIGVMRTSAVAFAAATSQSELPSTAGFFYSPDSITLPTGWTETPPTDPGSSQVFTARWDIVSDATGTTWHWSVAVITPVPSGFIQYRETSNSGWSFIYRASDTQYRVREPDGSWGLPIQLASPPPSIGWRLLFERSIEGNRLLQTNITPQNLATYNELLFTMLMKSTSPSGVLYHRNQVAFSIPQSEYKLLIDTQHFNVVASTGIGNLYNADNCIVAAFNTTINGGSTIGLSADFPPHLVSLPAAGTRAFIRMNLGTNSGGGAGLDLGAQVLREGRIYVLSHASDSFEIKMWGR